MNKQNKEWKPSDEQMEALMLAIEGKCPPTSYMSRRLEDLYDGLVNTYNIQENYLNNAGYSNHEQPSEDLEEAAEEWAENEAYGKSDAEFEMAYKGFIAGAEWHKRQMMKEAVEASVNYYENIPGGSYVEIVADILNQEGVRYKDNVKVIIVKEDKE